MFLSPQVLLLSHLCLVDFYLARRCHEHPRSNRSKNARTGNQARPCDRALLLQWVDLAWNLDDLHDRRRPASWIKAET